jgi:hypothetical protein
VLLRRCHRIHPAGPGDFDRCSQLPAQQVRYLPQRVHEGEDNALLYTPEDPSPETPHLRNGPFLRPRQPRPDRPFRYNHRLYLTVHYLSGIARHFCRPERQPRGSHLQPGQTLQFCPTSSRTDTQLSRQPEMFPPLFAGDHYRTRQPKHHCNRKRTEVHKGPHFARQGSEPSWRPEPEELQRTTTARAPRTGRRSASGTVEDRRPPALRDQSGRVISRSEEI